MLLSPIWLCPFLEEVPPPSLANVLFQRYRFLKSLLIETAETNLYLFHYIREYRGFNKINFMVENSTLRHQFFIVFLVLII